MPMEQGYSAGEGFDKYSATRVRKSEKHSILLDIVLIRITKVMSTTLAQLYSLGLTFLENPLCTGVEHYSFC